MSVVLGCVDLLRPGAGQVHPEILGLASNGQVVFAAWSARFTRRSSCRSRLCQSTTVTRSVPAVAFHRSGWRMRSPKIGPVCSSGRALQRIGRVKGATRVAKNPGYGPAPASPILGLW